MSTIYNIVPPALYYPQSNGMAEKAVQAVKNLLKKAIHDKQDPYIALLDYRNTLVSDTLGSPAQRLMGRRTKTLTPTMEKLWKSYYNLRLSTPDQYRMNY